MHHRVHRYWSQIIIRPVLRDQWHRADIVTANSIGNLASGNRPDTGPIVKSYVRGLSEYGTWNVVVESIDSTITTITANRSAVSRPSSYAPDRFPGSSRGGGFATRSTRNFEIPEFRGALHARASDAVKFTANVYYRLRATLNASLKAAGRGPAALNAAKRARLLNAELHYAVLEMRSCALALARSGGT